MTDTHTTPAGEKCETCNGAGERQQCDGPTGHMEPCDDCNGTGRATTPPMGGEMVSEERLLELRSRQFSRVLNTPRPTIDELEKILQRQDVHVEIQPNGEVRAVDDDDKTLIVALIDAELHRLRAERSERSEAGEIKAVTKWLEGVRDIALMNGFREMATRTLALLAVLSRSHREGGEEKSGGES